MRISRSELCILRILRQGVLTEILVAIAQALVVGAPGRAGTAGQNQQELPVPRHVACGCGSVSSLTRLLRLTAPSRSLKPQFAQGPRISALEKDKTLDTTRPVPTMGKVALGIAHACMYTWVICGTEQLVPFMLTHLVILMAETVMLAAERRH